MSKVKFSEFSKYSSEGGGNKYFSLKDKESASVRILYNTYDDIEGQLVHNIKIGDRYELITCPREDGDPYDKCVHCMNGNKPVLRVALPIYNEDAKQIQYWVRSGSYVEKDLKMVADLIVQQNKPIASQPYIIKRDGAGLDTKYMIIPSGTPDDKTKDSFGEFETDAVKLKIMREPNYEGSKDNVSNNTQTEVTATRRTTDIF